ncbi:Flp pilus assembly protein CpaB [Salinibacterium sp. GXW1014]|uniref:Flp pilus assembly protein CpaB n=1 Tax=Salinibacterium sp. GXW1014 TaxID=3377838 RepID=UPI00383A14B4
MFKNRVIAVVVAALLAVAGAILVFIYASNAEQRALEGVELRPVLVVTEFVPAGTVAADLGTSVAVQELPALSVAEGTVSSVEQLGDRVASADLLPGEQVFDARFVAADDSDASVPEGTQQLSFSLPTQRAVGGTVQSGDLVGVFVSIATAEGLPSTQLLLDGVQVLRVQGGMSDDGAEVTETVTVTLAVTAEQARSIVYSLEYGSVWLTEQPEDLDDTVSGELTREGLAQ